MASQGKGKLSEGDKAYSIPDLRVRDNYHHSMEDSVFESTPTVLNTMALPACLWSCFPQELSQRHGLGNNSALYGAVNRVLENEIALTDEHNKMYSSGSNSEQAREIIEQPVPDLDMINSVSDLSQRRVGIRLAAATLPKSPIGTSWGKAITAQLCSPLINKPYMNQFSSLTMNFEGPNITLQSKPQDRSLHHGLEIFGNQEDEKVLFSESIESLNRLLSGTNSNVDKSVDDNGISSHRHEIKATEIPMAFSNSQSLWNLGCSSAVSSGESENNGSNEIKQWRPNEPDETASQVSSQAKGNMEHKPQTRGFSLRISSPPKKIEKGANYLYFNLPRQESSTIENGFRLITETPPKSKKPKSENNSKEPSDINFLEHNSNSITTELDTEAIASMKEIIYLEAAFRPVNLGFEVAEKPKRKNVRISNDPQTVAARQRRERISDRIRVLQRLVPGGTKMDTASMLDEAANYVKFLRSQVSTLESLGHKHDTVSFTNSSWSSHIQHSFTSSSNPYPMQTFFPYSPQEP